MIPVGFEFSEWIDKNSDSLCLKDNAPDEVKKSFEEWKKSIHSPFIKQQDEIVGIKIEDLL